ncbi:MAG: hypothetical protein JKY31_08235 [Rhodobacteraceae bacterium]|nr:hypothetical protein [Paracoccaceae bacterium]
MSRKLIIHAPAELKKSIDAGRHNFFRILRQTVEEIGFTTATKRQTKHGGLLANLDHNYHIFNIDGAVGKRALNVRRAHFYPFWSLENAGTRRTPRISGKTFDPDQVNGIAAQDFFNKLCVRNLTTPKETLPQSDYVFVPLQGRILKQRSWQYASTEQMINTILEQDTRQIIVKPHPKEAYSEAELNYIKCLNLNPRITVSNADTDALLSQCAYVVTHNSSVAFHGFLYQKPAILFAQADYLHICQTVANPTQAASAFAKSQSLRPAFEKYLYWYLQMNCINAGRNEAPAKILEMLTECGWDVA